MTELERVAKRVSDLAFVAPEARPALADDAILLANACLDLTRDLHSERETTHAVKAILQKFLSVDNYTPNDALREIAPLFGWQFQTIDVLVKDETTYPLLQPDIFICLGPCGDGE